jgi:hypothetical protein
MTKLIIFSVISVFSGDFLSYLKAEKKKNLNQNKNYLEFNIGQIFSLYFIFWLFFF